MVRSAIPELLNDPSCTAASAKDTAGLSLEGPFKKEHEKPARASPTSARQTVVLKGMNKARHVLRVPEQSLLWRLE